MQQLGALSQPLLLVVELAALEREGALGHHRLELTALAVAQLALFAERDVERAVDPGRCLERHGHPAGVLERRSTCERVHVVRRERPHGLAARDRARERDVGVQADRTPRRERVLRVADVRDHLHGGAAAAGEDDEAGLGPDEPQRVRQARVADVDATRGERERGRHLLQALSLVRARCSLGLGASALELPDGEPGLVGEAPDDRNRRLVGLVHGGLPGDDEDQLSPSVDCDRRAERRADPELANALQAVVPSFGEDVGHEGDTESLDGLLEAREVPKRHPEPDGPLVARWIAAHELELGVVDSPEHAVVGAERRARLAADRRRHLVGGVGVEARRDLQDAVECRPGLALAIVETGALERLLGRGRDGRGNRGELVVDRVLALVQELDRAIRPVGNTQRHDDDGPDSRREDRRAVGKVALELVAIVRANERILANRSREDGPRVQRDAASGHVEARGNADRLDDEHVVALEERERRALGAQQRRRPLREDVRDLCRGGGAGEICAQLLEGAHVPERALGLERGLGRALPSEMQGACDHDDQGRDSEIDAPATHVLGIAQLEGATRLDEDPE